MNRNIVHRAKGTLLVVKGMFRLNGTSNPDNFRDGNTGDIESVTRNSIGNFTIKLRNTAGFTLPTKLLAHDAKLHQAANPTNWARAHYVKDSYSQSARTFQIQILQANATADTADKASDADDNDLVSFCIEGCIDSIGTDNVT